MYTDVSDGFFEFTGVVLDDGYKVVIENLPDFTDVSDTDGTTGGETLSECALTVVMAFVEFTGAVLDDENKVVQENLPNFTDVSDTDSTQRREKTTLSMIVVDTSEKNAPGRRRHFPQESLVDMSEKNAPGRRRHFPQESLRPHQP